MLIGFFQRMLKVVHQPTGFTLDAEALARTVNEAWIDNAPEGEFFYVRGFARKRFNEVVGQFVTDYFRRNGRLPEGNHHVVLESQRMIYFAPRTRSAQPSGLRSAALSKAA